MVTPCQTVASALALRGPGSNGKPETPERPGKAGTNGHGEDDGDAAKKALSIDLDQDVFFERSPGPAKSQ